MTPAGHCQFSWREGQKTEVKGFKMSQTRSKSLNPPVWVEATDIPQQAQNQFRCGYYIYVCVCVLIYLYVYHDLSIYSYIGTYIHTHIYIYRVCIHLIEEEKTSRIGIIG
jgi:hypothetical protein